MYTGDDVVVVGSWIPWNPLRLARGPRAQEAGEGMAAKLFVWWGALVAMAFARGGAVSTAGGAEGMRCGAR